MTQEFKDHIVQHPRRFRQTTVSPGVVELTPTWEENPNEVVQLGTPIDRQLFNGITSQLADIAINVKTFGAKGDGVTDDTQAIRDALAAVPKGGTLLIPPSSAGYKVMHKTEDYLFLIDKPINVLGMNSESTLVLDPTIPNTVDVFKIKPPTTGQNKGYSIKGVTIVGASGSTPARHAIHIDVTETHSKISDSDFAGNHLYPTGGKSIKLTNPTNTDGFFTSRISENLIYSGIELERGGDSLTVEKNTIPGFNSVDVGLVEGSNTFVFAFNNVTCRGGIKIRSGHNIKILFNNIEAGYADATGSNGALLDLDGSDITYSWGLLTTEVRGNNFTYRPGVPDGINAIRVNKARSAVIETNHIALKNSNHIVITNLASETILGYNLYSSTDPVGVIVDSGVRTIRKDAVRLNAAGNRELYAYDTQILRTRTDQWIKVTDKVTYDPKTKENAPSHVYLWNEANTFNSKHTIQSQKQLANGTLETAKTIANVADGYMYFVDGGFALVDSAGFRWKVTITTGGALTTTRI